MEDLKVPFVNTFYITLRHGIMYTYSHPQAIKSSDTNFDIVERFLSNEPMLRINIASDAVFVNNSLAKINKYGIDFLYNFFADRSMMGFLIAPGIQREEYVLFLKLLIEIKGADIPTIGRSFDSYGITHIQLLFKAPGGQTALISGNEGVGSVFMSGMQGGGQGSGQGGQGGYGTGQGGDGSGQGGYGDGTGQGGSGNGQGGSGSGQGGDQGYGVNSMRANAAQAQAQAQAAGFMPSQRKGSNLVAEISEDDVLLILNDKVGADYIEEKYELFPWKDLNNLERSIRLGKLSVLPKEYVEKLNLVELYKSVPNERITDVLDNISWLVSYNIGDNRDYVRMQIIKSLKQLIETVRVHDLPLIMPAVKYIFDYVGERDETAEFIDTLADLVMGYLDRLISDEHYAEITFIVKRLFTTSALSNNIPKKDIFEIIRNILEAYRKNLKSDSKEVIRGTLITLGELSVMPILQLLMDENDREMRRELMSILIAIGDPAIPYLKRMLIDRRWFVVRNGVKILGDIKTNYDIEVFWQPLTHSDARVRSEAITSLYNVGGLDAAKMLKRFLLIETNFELATKAVKGIAQLANKAIMNDLVSYVQQMAPTIAYAPVVQAVIDELVTFSLADAEFIEQIYSVLTMKAAFSIFSTDPVTDMKSYLLQRLRSRSPALFSLIASRIEKSYYKDLKKLIQKF